MPDKTNFAVLDALDFKIYLNPIKAHGWAKFGRLIGLCFNFANFSKLKSPARLQNNAAL